MKEKCEHTHSEPSGQPIQLDENQLYVLITEKPRQISRKLSQKMATVVRHLPSMCKVQNHGAWLQPTLIHKDSPPSIATNLFARYQASLG